LSLGLDEILTSSLVPRDTAARFAPPAEVLNPVSAERPCLRPSLFASMLETVGLNIRKGTADLAVFEIGTVFTPNPAGAEAPCSERRTISIMQTGRAQRREWHSAERHCDFFDLKGCVTALFEKFRVDKAATFCYDRSSSLSKNELHVDLNGISLGRLIEFSDDVLNAFDIDQPVFAAELELDALASAWTPERKLRRVSRFPQVERDLAFLLPDAVTAAQLLDAVRGAGARYLVDARVVDVFTHASFGGGRKSMALSLLFQSDDATLTEADIAAGTGEVTRAVTAALGATLRTI
jgi:phenylalanyl-tRNA synthetase beta chain